LEKTGEIEYFWMNSVRSHCYVTYKTVEQAKATREAVYNLMWPPANKSRLIAEFSTEEEALRRAEIAKLKESGSYPQQQTQQQRTQPTPQLQNPSTTTTTTNATNLSKSGDRDRDKDRERERERDKMDRGRERIDRDRRDHNNNRSQPPPPKVQLETLFRKTDAKPCIYWLPLSDKEIEDKRKITIQRA